MARGGDVPVAGLGIAIEHVGQVAPAGGLVRQELRIEVVGEGADLMLRGVNLLGGESHTDVTLVLGHNVAQTQSTETFRNVVLDKASGVFQGMIRVAPDAQKTDAKMACNTLLLSDEGDFAAKPELEIFADDVICGHGATVADISRTHLEVAPDGWQIVVTDLHSTNGTTLIRPGGYDQQRLTPGEPVPVQLGSVLELGDGVSVAIGPPQ